MPPKKVSSNAPSKKTEAKKKEKIVEDKTFGLKNKKGTKQQKFIQQVEKQVKGGTQKKNEILPNSAVVKDEKKKQLEELNTLFRPVMTQKVEKGVDPKSVLCAFFKSGQCGKKDKCKFSHDLTLERKSEKKNVYVDVRQEDTMEDWDEEKLKEVVEKKHGERDGKLPNTSIICKHFIEALELSKYGWFWECPNGGDKCHYKHCLPPGFVLNKDKKKADKKDDITIEELVEIERAKLDYNLAKITLESFLEWKQKKIKERAEKELKETDRKKAEFKAGKNVGLSGREMFTFNPEMAKDEDMDEGEDAYVHCDDDDEDNEELNYVEINLEALASQAKASDGSGTQCTARQFDVTNPQTSQPIEPGGGGGASGGSSTNEDDDQIIAEPIDETLFADEDLDLDDLDEELNSLSLEK